MKRFLLFGYADYYPEGGANDLRGDFDTAEEAISKALEGDTHEASDDFVDRFIETTYLETWHVIDTELEFLDVKYSMVAWGHDQEIGWKK